MNSSINNVVPGQDVLNFVSKTPTPTDTRKIYGGPLTMDDGTNYGESHVTTLWGAQSISSGRKERSITDWRLRFLSGGVFGIYQKQERYNGKW